MITAICDGVSMWAGGCVEREMGRGSREARAATFESARMAAVIEGFILATESLRLEAVSAKGLEATLYSFLPSDECLSLRHG